MKIISTSVETSRHYEAESITPKSEQILKERKIVRISDLKEGGIRVENKDKSILIADGLSLSGKQDKQLTITTTE